MKKYIYSLFMMVMALAVASCTEDQGTEPGGDSTPVATVYVYNAELPNDPDVDCKLRIAANSKVSEVYYIAEPTGSYESHMTELGDKGYADYVVSNGNKVDVEPAGTADITVKDLNGSNTIAVVAVNGPAKSIRTVEFFGYRWNNIVEGTYTFGYANAQSIFGFVSATTVLQQKDADPSQYRFKDLFGAGSHLVFTKTGMKSDDGGTYVRVAGQATPFSYGSYGTLNVRDVATWQGSDNYLDNVLYDDGNCYLWLQWYVSAGNTGYAYDEFVPAE